MTENFDWKQSEKQLKMNLDSEENIKMSGSKLR